MLVDPAVLVQQPAWVLTLTFGVIFLKILAAFIATYAAGYPWRIALMTGFALAQVGEFSFILAKEARIQGIMPEDGNALFLVVSMLTMIIAPFLIAVSPNAADLLDRVLTRIRRPSGAGGPAHRERMRIDAEEGGHLIIVGYGIGGRNVARAAQAAGIPYVVVEMNPSTVRAEKKKGTPMIYGDATQRVLLEHLGTRAARCLVIRVPHAQRR